MSGFRYRGFGRNWEDRKMISAKRVDATIPVSDLDRAVRWYKEKLGLEPTRQDKDMGATYRLPGGNGFMLYPTPTNAGKAPNTLMSFEVPDVVAEAASLRKAGVVFEEYDFPGLQDGKRHRHLWRHAWRLVQGCRRQHPCDRGRHALAATPRKANIRPLTLERDAGISCGTDRRLTPPPGRRVRASAGSRRPGVLRPLPPSVSRSPGGRG